MSGNWKYSLCYNWLCCAHDLLLRHLLVGTPLSAHQEWLLRTPSPIPHLHCWTLRPSCGHEMIPAAFSALSRTTSPWWRAARAPAEMNDTQRKSQWHEPMVSQNYYVWGVDNHSCGYRNPIHSQHNALPLSHLYIPANILSLFLCKRVNKNVVQ